MRTPAYDKFKLFKPPATTTGESNAFPTIYLYAAKYNPQTAPNIVTEVPIIFPSSGDSR